MGTNTRSQPIREMILEFLALLENTIARIRVIPCPRGAILAHSHRFAIHGRPQGVPSHPRVFRAS